MEVEEKVKDIIDDVVGILPKSSDYFSDLGMDELDKIEVIMRVEKEFAINISDEEYNSLVSVSGLCSFVMLSIGSNKF